MANNTQLNRGESGDIINTLDEGGVKTQIVVPAYLNAAGLVTKASIASPLPILDSAPEISLDRITGFAAFREFGSNSSIGTSETYVAIVGGSAPYMPSTPVTVEAISSSANDASAGTGARQITVTGLDSDWNLASEVITMNGTGATTATATSFYRVHSANVSAVGTYRGSNAGDITLRASGGGTSFVIISAGIGEGQGSHYCVPAGKTLLVIEIHMVVDSLKTSNPVFWQAPNANDLSATYSGAKRAIQRYTGAEGMSDFSFNPSIAFPAYTDIWFSSTVASGTGAISVEYNGYLVDN